MCDTSKTCADSDRFAAARGLMAGSALGVLLWLLLICAFCAF
jgi:hypothetical protein